MKIAFLVRSLGQGGADRRLATLAVGLKRLGHEVSVIAIYGENASAAEIEKAGVRVRSLEKKGRRDIFPFLRRLRRTLGRERPDILFGSSPVANILIGMVKPFLKGAKTVFGVHAVRTGAKKSDWLARLFHRFETDFAQWCDSIIVGSDNDRKQMEKRGFPAPRISVISSGVDTARFRPDDEVRAHIRSAFGVDPRIPVIGLVARLEPAQDHPNFLHAAAEFHRRIPEVKFVCVGHGPAAYRVYLEKLAERVGVAGRVLWTGAREDVHVVVNGFDVATLASNDDGFPICLLEAMACGVPCVTTDVGEAGRIVGDTGIVVPRRQPEALAKGWFDMLHRLRYARTELRETARRRIVAEFSRDSLVARIERHFHAVLEA